MSSTSVPKKRLSRPCTNPELSCSLARSLVGSITISHVPWKRQEVVAAQVQDERYKITRRANLSQVYFIRAHQWRRPHLLYYYYSSIYASRATAFTCNITRARGCRVCLPAFKLRTQVGSPELPRPSPSTCSLLVCRSRG